MRAAATGPRGREAAAAAARQGAPDVQEGYFPVSLARRLTLEEPEPDPPGVRRAPPPYRTWAVARALLAVALVATLLGAAVASSRTRGGGTGPTAAPTRARPAGATALQETRPFSTCATLGCAAASASNPPASCRCDPGCASGARGGCCADYASVCAQQGYADWPSGEPAAAASAAVSSAAAPSAVGGPTAAASGGYADWPSGEPAAAASAAASSAAAPSAAVGPAAAAASGAPPGRSPGRRQPPAAASGAPSSAAAASGAPPRGPPRGTSLYCMSLMLPFGSEFGLLSWQFQHRTGIFLCEAYMVFSNETLSLEPLNGSVSTLTTWPLKGSLVCPYGGKWGTAMNTDVFIKAWKAVYDQGTYAQHDWTVKVDPDCVFFPQRLRQLLSGQVGFASEVPSGPIFFNNCQWGMHGPLEVVSTEGMNTFFSGMETGCAGIRNAAMGISQPADLHRWDRAFGEDQYMRRCLRTLGVTQVDNFKLLSEKVACGEHPADCGGMRVAFHSFKSAAEYRECYVFANYYSRWPTGPPEIPKATTTAAPQAAYLAPGVAPTAAPSAAAQPSSPSFWAGRLQSIVDRIRSR